MNHNYDDIRSRIPMDPLWWDENAVPRYSAFGPREVANIYADEAVLAEVACQSCARLFRVAFSQCAFDRVIGRKPVPLAEQIREQTLHYGDPPNIGCCAAGPTMNSVPVRVLEYWSRESPLLEWQRVAALEVAITPDWESGTEAGA